MNVPVRAFALTLGFLLPLFVPATLAAPPEGRPLVVTEVPSSPSGEAAALAGGALRADWPSGTRLVSVSPSGALKVLSSGFASAADPEVSFDGERILFSGRRKATDPWCIYEMQKDGAAARLVTCGKGDCRRPIYQPKVFTLTPTSTEAVDLVAFSGSDGSKANEDGSPARANLYSCKLDGSGLRRLTFNLSTDTDPVVLPDGRMVFAAWLRSPSGPAGGRVDLLGVNLDGTDYQTYSGDQGLRVKQAPAVTTKGLLVFVEGESLDGAGGGSLGSVSLRRNLHSYRALTREQDGLYAFPSPTADGKVLVSWRARRGGRSAVYAFDPDTRVRTRVFEDAAFESVEAKAVAPRGLPDSRSSVVQESDALGKLYALDVGLNDLQGLLPRSAQKSLRVVEGLAPLPGEPPQPPFAPSRILGVVPLASDGSFEIQLPANLPVKLQLLDEDGLAVSTSTWLWVRNHANQGCVGCHEDPELTPPNRFVKALAEGAVLLDPPPEKRRGVDFERDIVPILKSRCASCHGEGGAPPRLDGGQVGGLLELYRTLLSGAVVPGAARRSPLVWHALGRNTSRPFDKGDFERKPALVPGDSRPLPAGERETLCEWIDLGALYTSGGER